MRSNNTQLNTPVMKSPHPKGPVKPFYPKVYYEYNGYSDTK